MSGGRRRQRTVRAPMLLFYSVPARLSLKELRYRLIGALGLRELASEDRACSYLDTFDRSILRGGGVLEYLRSDDDSRLRWRCAEQLKASFSTRAQPRLAADMPPSRVGAELARLVGLRALLPLVESHQKVRRFIKVGAEDKIHLRLDLIDEGLAGEKPFRYLALQSMTGYEKALAELRDALARCGCRPLGQDPAVTVFHAASVPTVPAASWNDYQLQPDQRTDAAARLILSGLREEMERNLDGLLKDLDSEFLHDFRVAVRRTRSLLGQVKGIFPLRRLRRFADGFAWLGTLTGPTRDLDVYLLTLPGYQARLPAGQGAALAPLQDYLQRHQRKEQQALAKALRTSRYQKLMADWGVFLAESAPSRSQLSNSARPVEEVAGERIWRLFRRVIKEGRAIGTDSPPEDLHELRKSGKKLRYLLEFFRGLYPGDEIKSLITELKQLQDNLGDYQDLAVQQASFEGFRSGMQAEGMLDPRADAALVHLVELLALRETEVRAEFAEHFQRFEAKPVRRRFAALFKPPKPPGKKVIPGGGDAP